MKCAEVRQVLPEVMENGPDGELEAHLAVCPTCSELVSDLRLIASEASELADSVEPSPRVWIRIAAQLRAEGLIREPEAVPASPVPVSLSRRWRAWWLAPVAAMLVAVGAYVVTQKQVDQGPPMALAPQISAPQTSASQTSGPQTQISASRTQTSEAHNQTAQAKAAAARSGTQQKLSLPAEVAEGPSPEDQQFLSEVSQRAPSMRATYENQLASVNNYIREVQAYLNQNPDDEDARQHLMEAYQQKAMLYKMALEHVQ